MWGLSYPIGEEEGLDKLIVRMQNCDFKEMRRNSLKYSKKHFNKKNLFNVLDVFFD